MTEADGPLPARRARRAPLAPERRFLDHEVAAILARAASREASSDLPAPHDPTLADLMSAAAEAGLDPAEVRRAAALVPPAPAGFAGVALGAPDQREVVAVLEGARLPAETHALVRTAERLSGYRGEVVDSAPGLLVWEERHLGGRTTVSLAEAGGALELRVSADRAGAYAGLWFAGLVAWAVLSALTPLGALPLLGKALGFVLAPLLIARPFWVVADRRLQARLEHAVMDLARVSEQAGPAGAVSDP